MGPVTDPKARSIEIALQTLERALRLETSTVPRGPDWETDVSHLLAGAVTCLWPWLDEVFRRRLCRETLDMAHRALLESSDGGSVPPRPVG